MTAQVPAGACDCHGHVFGPFDRFPPRETPSYDPPPAAFEVHRGRLTAAGLDRAVIVQPAIYGRDHSAMYDALARGEGALAGVGVTHDAQVLRDMAANGVRALRFVDRTDPSGKPYAGAVASSVLARLKGPMTAAGLHAELWAGIAGGLAVAAAYAAPELPVVLDHMAGVDAAAGVDDPAFRLLLEHLADGNIWVKLTVCRASADRPDHASLRPFHEALVAARPDRLVWGSDFPFIRLPPGLSPEGELARFLDWTPDPDLRSMILVDNPSRLYGLQG